MKSIIIETLFKHCKDLEELWNKYGALLNKSEIISNNTECKTIKKNQIKKFYKKFLKSYNPVFDALFLKGKNIVIAINSMEEVVDDYKKTKTDIIFISEQKIKNNLGENDFSLDYIRIIILPEDLDKTDKTISEINAKKELVVEKIKNEHFNEASRLCKQLADLYYELGLLCSARTYYGYAAIAAERTEKWREITYLWYCAYEPIKNEKSYFDYNSLEHSFPSISFEKWQSLDDNEKKGRALQYSAYSDDNHGGPSDSYWIYEKAALKYLKSGNYKRAVECATSATNRYAICYHKINEDLINLWKKLINDHRAWENHDLLYISFNDIYRNLNLYESEETDFFYVEAKKIQQKKLLKNKRFFSFAINKLWSMVTKYGTNVSRITLITFFLVFLLFPMAYLGSCYNFEKPISITVDTIYCFIDCVKFSLDVFFNIGSTPELNGVFHFWVIIETFYSYVTMVIVSSSIIGKLLRQKI